MTPKNKERLLNMLFESLYAAYVQKLSKKEIQNSEQEVLTALCWLTGYTENQVISMINNQNTFGYFLEYAPSWNKETIYITGKICGENISEITDDLQRKIRYIDKVMDNISKKKGYY